MITPEISNEVRANYSNDRVGSKIRSGQFRRSRAASRFRSCSLPGTRPRMASSNSYILGAGEYVQGKQGRTSNARSIWSTIYPMTKAGHQLKFGVDYRWLAPFSSPILLLAYLREFSGVTADAWRSSFGNGFDRRDRPPIKANALLSQNFSLYGQDTWKITPRLTVTYGLRWDVNPPLKGKKSANDPFTVTGLNNPATMSLAPRGTPLYQTTYGNVAPRLGIA